MRVLRKINNYAAICEDQNHHELIAFGKGIGFHQTPYDLDDLSIITRTYYGVDPKYLGLLNDIPEQIFELAAKVVDIARVKIHCELNPNLLFTLADHINFAVERLRKGIVIKNPLYYDIEHLYTTEVEIGKKALQMIHEAEKVHLPESEAFGIAIHFINAEEVFEDSSTCDSESVIDEITKIVEKYWKKSINKKTFNYSRFVSHLRYLLKRRDNDSHISSENEKMFTSMMEQFPQSYTCVLDIKNYLMNSMDWNVSDEELLYLMLHVNRLCVREDCYQ